MSVPPHQYLFVNRIKYYRQAHPFLNYPPRLDFVHECSAAQSRLTFCDPADCSPPGSSVRGNSQARGLEWVAIFFSTGPSRSRDWTYVSCISCIGRWILYQCATWEARNLDFPNYVGSQLKKHSCISNNEINPPFLNEASFSQLLFVLYHCLASSFCVMFYLFFTLRFRSFPTFSFLPSGKKSNRPTWFPWFFSLLLLFSLFLQFLLLSVSFCLSPFIHSVLMHPSIHYSVNT